MVNLVRLCEALNLDKSKTANFLFPEQSNPVNNFYRHSRGSSNGLSMSELSRLSAWTGLSADELMHPKYAIELPEMPAFTGWEARSNGGRHEFRSGGLVAVAIRNDMEDWYNVRLSLADMLLQERIPSDVTITQLINWLDERKQLFYKHK